MNQPTEVGTGYYVGITAPENAALRDRMNEILLRAMKDGRLEAIFRRWNMWNDDQPRFYAKLLSGERIPQSAEQPPTQALTGWMRPSGIFQPSGVRLWSPLCCRVCRWRSL